MSRTEQVRLETLKFLIEPSQDDLDEIRRLEKHCKQQRQAAMDELDDPDPDNIAARQTGIWCDLYDKRVKHEEFLCVKAERDYRKRSEEMNTHRL